MTGQEWLLIALSKVEELTKPSAGSDVAVCGRLGPGMGHWIPRHQELYCTLGSWVMMGRKGVLERMSFGGHGGDCAHCWSDGVDGVAGTLQNCQRKQSCRVTLDRSHQTPMIGMCSLSGCCCRHRGTGVVGSNKNNGSVGPRSGSHASLQI
jgi:hypothetical protein